MTVSSTTSRIDFTGNGVITTFAYPFLIFATSDLQVYVAGTLMTLTTDYAVTGEGSPSGGNVVFVSAPANAAAVAIVRNVPETQGTDYVENAAFPANDTETALDKLTVISQQLTEQLARAPKLATSSTESDISVDDLAGSSGLFVRVNAPEDGFEYASITAAGSIGIPVSIANGGTNRADGALGLPEMAAPAGVVGKSIIYDDSTSKRATMKNNNGAATAVLGASDITTVVKKGSAAGTYVAAADLLFHDVDAVNLAYTVTIPVGYKLSIRCSGVIGTNTVSDFAGLFLDDGGAALNGSQRSIYSGSLGPSASFCTEGVITGDGASHTIKLRYFNFAAAHAAAIENTNPFACPIMIFEMKPSA